MLNASVAEARAEREARLVVERKAKAQITQQAEEVRILFLPGLLGCWLLAAGLLALILIPTLLSQKLPSLSDASADGDR